MFVVEDIFGRLGVLAVAILVLVAFLTWSRRTRSAGFFRGVLAGTGLVLAFDIVWVHWVFGLHHLTNHAEDIVLEPALVVVGIVFLWYAITREPRSG
jgi:fructose-specific phosphotransferase system IIC component